MATQKRGCFYFWFEDYFTHLGCFSWYIFEFGHTEQTRLTDPQTRYRPDLQTRYRPDHDRHRPTDPLQTGLTDPLQTVLTDQIQTRPRQAQTHRPATDWTHRPGTDPQTRSQARPIKTLESRYITKYTVLHSMRRKIGISVFISGGMLHAKGRCPVTGYNNWHRFSIRPKTALFYWYCVVVYINWTTLMFTNRSSFLVVTFQLFCNVLCLKYCLPSGFMCPL